MRRTRRSSPARERRYLTGFMRLLDARSPNFYATARHRITQLQHFTIRQKHQFSLFCRDFVEPRAVSSHFSKEDWDKRLQRPGTDVQNFKQPSPPPSSSHHNYQSPSSSRAAGRRLLVSRSRHSVLSDSSHFF